MPADSMSWSRHHMPDTTTPQSLSHPNELPFFPCRDVLDELPHTSSMQSLDKGNWQQHEQTSHTPHNTKHAPCSIQRCRGLLWCAEELHMSSFCTQKHEDVIYLSLSLQPKYSLTDTSPYKVLCIRVCIPEESFNLFSVEWLVICEHNVPDKTFVMEHVNVLLLVLEPWQCP